MQLVPDQGIGRIGTSAIPNDVTLPSLSPPVSQATLSSVPAQIASIIGHSLRISGPNAGPMTSCQTLVTNEGTISKLAAVTGEIRAPAPPWRPSAAPCR